ncbi:MAG: hypothetical protein H6R21_1804, partial [Proteobacteria bacterium]|nr:hypothetical protein [Pseudomonadota bacterium]
MTVILNAVRGSVLVTVLAAAVVLSGCA